MILGIDIGGTSVKMGFVGHDGTIHARYEASVCFDAYQTPILSTVIAAAKKCIAQHQMDIEGIGVSATGQIDTETGVVIGTNGKIPNYEGAEIKRELEAAFNVPVCVINDANAAVLGECFSGMAKGMRNVLMITLGTGVGGGVVVNGEVLRGARGIAGELGHFTLYQNGIQCSCGKRGCYENYASTSALLVKARIAAGNPLLNGQDIFDLVRNGDILLRNVLNQWLDDIAAGITGLIHVFNPQMVLIGGGVSVQEELLLKPLRERIYASVMPCFAENLRIERASLGNNAGLIGAVQFFRAKGNLGTS